MISRDPDDLHGDDVVAALTIAVRRNGAMSVAGAINDYAYAIAMLDSAKDAVRNHHDRQRIENGGLIIPAGESAIQ